MYCLWFTDQSGKDRFLTNDKGVLFFTTHSDLSIYISEEKLNIDHNQIHYDIGSAIDWLSKDSRFVDCEYMLHIWNITSDLSSSANKDFSGDSTSEIINRVYDKLFWGNNLSALRDNEDAFNPDWTSEELQELKIVVTHIVDIIKSVFTID